MRVPQLKVGAYSESMSSSQSEEERGSMTIYSLGRTGPKSIPGKQNSRFNAYKHGGYAKTKIMPFEDEREYKKLVKDVHLALHPGPNRVLQTMATQLADILWQIARVELSMSFEVDREFSRLDHHYLNAMLDIDERFQDYLPSYYFDPNFKLPRYSVSTHLEILSQYEQLLVGASGIANFDLVWRHYPVLFQGFAEWLKDVTVEQHGERRQLCPLFMEHGKNLELAWQQNPQKLLAYMEEYVASVYFALNFKAYKPQIKLALATWYFLDRAHAPINKKHDEVIMRLQKRYQSLLTSYQQLRETEDAHQVFVNRLSTMVTKRNEMNKNL